LIDTSPTFAFGDSERLVGQELRRLIQGGDLRREEIVLLTKVGVALGAAAEQLEERRRSGDEPLHACPLVAQGQSEAPAGASFASGAFCLEPKFLRESLSASLQRLGVAHVDFCLVQSPEHLLAAGKTPVELEAALESAFETLEEEVAEGRIGAYGVLTNTATRPSNDPLFLDLQTLLKAAKKAGGNKHHLRILELPLNLVETFALEKADGVSVLAAAHEHGLSVFATRPLSPFVGGALLRLVDPPAASEQDPETQLKSTRYRIASLEAEFETTLAVALRLAKKAGSERVLPLSGSLGRALEQSETREQFRLAESTMVTPRLRQLLSQLDRSFAGPGDAKWKKFRDDYIRAVGNYLAAIDQFATQKNRQILSDLEKKIGTSASFSDANAARPKGEPWAERALGLLISVPGVSAALVGLRKSGHVEGALRVLHGRS
jgi:aryl-alcohol dehydrogenase-like predicted oxidoreductase